MNSVRIARVGLHYFEEPCISGDSGSGTIFFSGCTLKCKFCQNYNISHLNEGIDISLEQLEKCFYYLQDLGANNINLVTPGLYVPQIKEALEKAKPNLMIPVVWNSSGYESTKSIEMMKGLVNIFLPDFKYSDDNLAIQYSNARNYREIAFKAISKMREICPIDEFDENGLMKRGVIVRHLVLPTYIENSFGVIDDIAKIDKTLYVSIMSQYFPTKNVLDDEILSQRVSAKDYDKVVDHFFEMGLKNGFSQDAESAIEDYVPSFDLENLADILKKL